MSIQSSFGRKMNLNFTAEHTADTESAKTFKIGEFCKQIYQFAIHVVKKCQSIDWEKRFDRMASPKTKKEKNSIRQRSFENQGIKEQDFITLVFIWSLLGGAFFSDEILRRRTYGETEAWKNCKRLF